MSTDDPSVSLEIPEGEAKARSAGRRARLRAGEKKRSRVGHATDPELLRRRVYEFSDLSSYKWSDRFLIYAADVIFYLLIRLICSTLRWEARGREHLEAIHASGHRAIYTFWHSCIFSATWTWRKRGIVVMSSNSRDAEYIGRFIKRLGYGTARGSATRGGGRALAEMSECLGHAIDVAFTIDGPRGPAYVAKAGAVTLARHSGQAILPFHVASSSYWTLPSWDRLQIPRPFTRAVTMIGEPIYVSREDSPGEVSAKQELLQATLDRLRREGEEAASGR
ncbi:MAG TPA: lysophospholipid acyltransferase family protein [Blastocatellia bacterium]|nr:lysophospholipid acyltransferase family protein [Blastocatellia bacterium]